MFAFMFGLMWRLLFTVVVLGYFGTEIRYKNKIVKKSWRLW